MTLCECDKLRPWFRIQGCGSGLCVASVPATRRGILGGQSAVLTGATPVPMAGLLASAWLWTLFAEAAAVVNKCAYVDQDW